MNPVHLLAGFIVGFAVVAFFVWCFAVGWWLAGRLDSRRRP